jgi:hypothetical protein
VGAWDVGIFDNDTSADVRGFYEDALAQDERTAAARILERFAEDLDEPEVAPDVWFGLAGSQWEYGRPDPAVVQRALAIIDGGRDLERWRELGASEESLRGRAEALQAFRRQLLSEPPPRTDPAAPAQLPATSFAVGDILAYELPSGRFMPLAVIHVPSTLTSGSAPICTFAPEALAEPPTSEEFMRMDIAEDPFGMQQMLVAHWEERPAPIAEVPDELTARPLMLWLVADTPDDEAHERERVRPVGRFEMQIAMVGHVERLPWTGLAAYVAQHFDVR